MNRCFCTMSQVKCFIISSHMLRGAAVVCPIVVHFGWVWLLSWMTPLTTVISLILPEYSYWERVCGLAPICPSICVPVVTNQSHICSAPTHSLLKALLRFKQIERGAWLEFHIVTTLRNRWLHMFCHIKHVAANNWCQKSNVWCDDEMFSLNHTISCLVELN